MYRGCLSAYMVQPEESPQKIFEQETNVMTVPVLNGEGKLPLS